MKAAVISSAWFTLRPRIDAGYWLAISARIEESGVDPTAATLDQVRAAIEASEADARSDYERAADMRRQAAALINEARRLESSIPPVISKPRKESSQ